MKYVFYTVRRLHRIKTLPGHFLDNNDYEYSANKEPIAITCLCLYGSADSITPIFISLPSGKFCFLNYIDFIFEEITEEQYGTYYQFNLFPIEDSDLFTKKIDL